MAEMFADIHDPAARVRALCSYGCQVEMEMNIPARRYYRSGLEMIRMANVYESEGNFESAFVLYSKFIALFVEKLPRHPDFKSVPPEDKSKNKKKLKEAFIIAEELKKKLLERYAAAEKRYQEEEKKLLAIQQQQEAAEEAKRRAEEAARQEAEEKMRLAEEERWRTEQVEQYHYLQEQERNRLNQQKQQEKDDAALAAALSAQLNAGEVLPSHVPDVSPPSYQDAANIPSLPSRELKPAVSPSAPPVYDFGTPPSALANSVPAVDRSTKPSVDHFTSVGGTTSNKYGLKDVWVPAELMTKFLNIALPNTHRNIETCGILCGKLSQGTFRITHLVIPQQSGTPDSCATKKEKSTDCDSA